MEGHETRKKKRKLLPFAMCFERKEFLITSGNTTI